MLPLNDKTAKKNVSPTSEPTLRGFVRKELRKQMGKEEFNKLHHLEQEILMEEYWVENQEELKKMFPEDYLL